MHLGLTNVPAIKRLPPLVAKWGGKMTGAAAQGSGSEDQEAVRHRERRWGGPWKKSRLYWGWA